MAGYLNRATIIGNVGGDPEIKNLGNGGVVANFTVATTESWKDKNSGEKKERTEWHRIVVWNEGLCGVIENYVRKGTKIMVEGELQTRKWEKDGIERYSTEIVLTGFSGKLLLLGGKGEGGNRDTNDNKSRPGNQGGGDYASASGGSASMGDEIPFAPEWR